MHGSDADGAEMNSTQEQVVTASRRRILQVAGMAGLTAAAGMGVLNVLGSRSANARQAASDTPAGSIIWAIESDPASLVPYGSGSTSNMWGKEFIYDSLLEWDRDLNIQPALAESWEAAPDLMSFTFNLRRGVTFHNGKEMTAADVKYSLDLSLNPEPPVLPSAYLANISEVVIVDDYTVRIDMKAADPTVPGLLAWQRFTPIFPEGIADEINLLAEGIGTGPFRLITYESNAYLDFEAFENYWKPGVPCVQQLRLVVVPDEQSRVAQLRSGEIDGGTFSADTIPTLEGDESLEVLSGLTSAPRLIYVNTVRDVPWRDKRVRLAVSKTIDRQVIIDNVYAGQAVLSGPIPPGFGDWALPEERLREIYTVDVEGAKALMAEAGYADGFSVNLPAISTPRHYTQIAEIIAEQLKQINIDVNVQPQEIGTFVETINSEYDWASTGAGMRADPSGHLIGFRTGIGTYEVMFGEGWKNDEFNELYDEALITTDHERRRELYFRLQEIIIAEEAANFYLVQPMKFHVVNRRISGMYVAYNDFHTGLRTACAAE